MFYSHEGKLHSRSLHLHGNEFDTLSSLDFAQVWRSHDMVQAMSHSLFSTSLLTLFRLVATLGSRSSLKKVGRKDILNVDVPKACKTIVSPEAPMALRLQSNLL